MDGLAVVDKEAGWTSHDVVARARGILGTRRVGHAGTLDPDATGILLLGVGRVTRLLRFLTALPKTYTATVVLGVETSTLDASGEVVATHDMGTVTADQVRAAARGLTGDILQVPPMVSAVRVGGRRLHELARQGLEVDREARPVTVHRFDVAPTDEPGRWRVTVVCSSGTYVRTLAADLGRALGGGAHLGDLRRTAVGSFTEDDALALQALGPGDLRSPAEAMRDLPRRGVGPDVARAVGFGKVLSADVLGVADGAEGPWAVVDGEGRLLAVYQRHEAAGPGALKPAVVVAPAEAGSSTNTGHG